MINQYCSFCVNKICGPSLITLSFHLAGVLLYSWLLQQSTHCETKSEYDASYHKLLKFLELDETVQNIGKDAVEAVLDLQHSLRAKEHKLAFYLRMDTHNSMDACTTSPVESANAAIKHGPNKVHSNMNLDKSTRKMIEGFNRRLKRRKNQALRDLGLTNLASRAPTSPYIITKIQGLIDRFYDQRHVLKSAQVGPETWHVWNFDSYIEDEST